MKQCQEFVKILNFKYNNKNSNSDAFPCNHTGSHCRPQSFTLFQKAWWFPVPQSWYNCQEWEFYEVSIEFQEEEKPTHLNYSFVNSSTRLSYTPKDSRNNGSKATAAISNPVSGFKHTCSNIILHFTLITFVIYSQVLCSVTEPL